MRIFKLFSVFLMATFVSQSSASFFIPDGAVTNAKMASAYINSLTTVTAELGDYVAIADTSASGAKKKALISDIKNDRVRTISSFPATATSEDEVYKFTATSGALTLPAGVAGKRLVFIHGGTSETNLYTITPASGLIGGLSTWVMKTANQITEIEYDGSTWRVLREIGADVELHLHTGNGYGNSAGTKIRRYTTTAKNTLGQYATMTDTTGDGTYVTVNVGGMYAITVMDTAASAAGALIGIVINGTALTTDVGSVTYAQGRRCMGVDYVAGAPGSCSVTLRLAPTDTIRVQGQAGTNSTAANLATLLISRVAL